MFSPEGGTLLTKVTKELEKGDNKGMFLVNNTIEEILRRESYVEEVSLEILLKRSLMDRFS